MAQGHPSTPLQPSRSHRLLTELPSWLVSLTLHVCVLLLFGSNLRSCGHPLPGSPEGDFREVGIYVKQAEQLNEPTEQPEQAENSPTEPTVSNNTAELSQPEQLEETPPAPLSTPSVEKPVIGGGAPPPSDVPADVRNLPKPGGVYRPSQLANLGAQEAEFFGIRTKGTRVVYALDASGSMANYNAIRVAKAELMASLQRLEETQKFQVIFYNQTPRVMTLQGRSDQDLYWANDINRTLARQFISGIQADSGTRHMLALKQALRLNPDIIFFLTDADEPQLTARELHEIQTLNDGRAQIHCVEFGQGRQLAGRVANFLEKLARQNGGRYQYRDVTQFDRR